MKVLTDDVEEIQIGNLSKWKHKLKLIELTTELQKIIIPDFSNRQSLDYIKSKENEE